jgi:hypothetical protein
VMVADERNDVLKPGQVFQHTCAHVAMPFVLAYFSWGQIRPLVYDIIGKGELAYIVQQACTLG